MSQIHPVELFSGILKSLGMTIDSSGTVNIPLSHGETCPVIINERRLVLPTQEVLTSYNPAAQIAFQPFSESVLRAESDVIRKLRDMVNVRVQSVLGELLTIIAGQAADTNATLRPEQIKLTSLLPNADDKLVTNLGKILHRLKAGGEARLFNVYLRRIGKIGEVEYKRLAVVSFPIMDELSSHTDTVWGVKVRKGDKSQLHDLMLGLLPHCGSEHAYSVGSNSPTAPYFDSLVHAFYKVIAPLNKVVQMFRKQVNITEIHSNLDWIEACGDFSVYRGILPSLSGNEGDLMDGPPTVTSGALPITNYTQPIAGATGATPDANTYQRFNAAQPDDGSAWQAAVMQKTQPQHALSLPSFPRVNQPYVAPSPAAPVYAQPAMQYGYGAPAPASQAYPTYQTIHQPVPSFPRVSHVQPIAPTYGGSTYPAVQPSGLLF